jgi:hypothetical protein
LGGGVIDLAPYLQRLIAGGCDPVVATTVVSEVVITMAAETDKRSPGAIRQARYRERLAERNKRNETSQNITEVTMVTQKENPPHPLKKNTSPCLPSADIPRSKSKGSMLPDDWKPSPEGVEYGLKLGLGADAVMLCAEEMASWARANEHRAVARKSNWDAAFQGWLRREAKNKGRGNGKSGPTENRSVVAAAHRLVERMQQWDEPVGSGEGGGSVVRLLPGR